jgi:tetratricopeptide (TPR) repeat protein
MTVALFIAVLAGQAVAQTTPDWATGTLAPPVVVPVQTEAAAPLVAAATPAGAATLPPLLQSRFDQAVRAEGIKDWTKAESLYASVLSGQARHAPAVMGLGRAREGLGNSESAIEAYAMLPKHPGAIESKAYLLEKTQPRQAAALYQDLQALRPEAADPHLFEARAMLRVKGGDPPGPVIAAKCIDRYLKRVVSEPNAAVILDAVGALVEMDEDEQAEVLLMRFLQKWDHMDEAPEFRARLDRIRVERQASELGVGGAEPLSSALREQVEEARQLAADGDLNGALLELQAVVQDAPRGAEAWAALGDIHELLDQLGDAEQAFAWAAALEPEEATWHVRLGMLLAKSYGGKRDRDARDQLRTAVALRPNQAGLRFQLARVYHSLRDYDLALEHYQAYISADPGGNWSGIAAEAVEALSRKAPLPLEPVQGGARPSDVPAEALRFYKTARVYREKEDLGRARIELAKALEIAPDWLAAVNLEAAIELGEGDTDGAIAVWERSLKIDPSQARIRLAIGEIYRQRGDLAASRQTLTRAAEDGAADAYYLLADMSYEAHDYLDAEAALSSYFDHSTGGLRYDPAQALRQRVQTRLLQIKSAIGGSLALVLGLLAVFVFRRRTGARLDALTAAAPEAAHDVARVVSAIRHELLKHNTSLLEEMATALDHGDDHAVSWGANRLFGTPDQPGVEARFKEYRRGLERLGRRHGVRLDLRRTDPVFAPMHEALQALQAQERVLRKPPRSQAARERVADALRGISLVLNEEAYAGLGKILQTLGTLQLDRSRLQAVDARVRAEPGMNGKDLPALQLELPTVPLSVRVFPGDLDDIVANLLRNAYGAITTGGRVGLAVAEAVDPVTGIAAVELRVRDTAPGEFTDATLHGQEIGRGLGLTTDLVARHDGTVHVQPEPGWSKAIVVSLRKVDQVAQTVAVVEEVA